LVVRHRRNGLFMRGRRPLQGQRVFLGRGLATNILARWATIRWAHTCRTRPVMRGLRPLQGQRVFLVGPCYQYIGPLGHNPLGTYVPHPPRNARSSAPTGPTCFVARGLATDRLARWATIRFVYLDFTRFNIRLLETCIAHQIQFHIFSTNRDTPP